MPSSPPRLIVFDMDDVLCGYDWPGRVAALADYAGRPGAEVAAAIWGSGFEDSADRGAIGAEAYLAGFAERLGAPFSRDDWIANRRAAMTPWPAMLALAKALSRQATVAILTNNGHLTADSLDALFPELLPIFGPRILFSAELGAQKPEPVIFARALARLGFAPADTLFTDDRPENVAGAVEAGLHGHVHAGPDALLARLAQMGWLNSQISLAN
jgi:putative hydrolase of the HAD superfamily